MDKQTRGSMPTYGELWYKNRCLEKALAKKNPPRDPTSRLDSQLIRNKFLVGRIGWLQEDLKKFEEENDALSRQIKELTEDRDYFRKLSHNLYQNLKATALKEEDEEKSPEKEEVRPSTISYEDILAALGNLPPQSIVHLNQELRRRGYVDQDVMRTITELGAERDHLQKELEKMGELLLKTRLEFLKIRSSSGKTPASPSSCSDIPTAKQ